MNEECVKLAVLSSELNFDELNFIEFFELDICQPYGGQMIGTGGNLSKFKNNKILLTVGGFESYEVQKNDNPQKLDNMIGKILSIDKETKKVNILSLGHRNSQGLFYDEFDDVIYSTDHGPKGGDEININHKPFSEIKNFGWPISSYGEHYSKHYSKKILKEAPLNKSHKKYGFIEPVKYFVPSIGISQLVSINNEDSEFFVGAMGNEIKDQDLGIHYIKLNENRDKVIKHKYIPLNERVRDMVVSKDQKIILIFLETSSSIVILNKQEN